MKFLSKARTTEGTIVKFAIENVYYPIYTYEFPQGILHRKKHHSGSTQMLMGGKLHVFKSGNIWYDPTEFIDRDEVDIYFMPRNPKAYYMDIAFLPELAE